MDLKQFDLNLLLLFDKLYQYRSVSKAAESLYLSQSAFSHGLARLRKRLDDPLFIRVNNQMQATERAEQLALYVKQALPLLELGLGQASGFDASHSEKTFRIAATDYTEFCFLPKLTRHFAKQAPHIQIEILPASPLPIKEQLEQRNLDFVLGFQHGEHPQAGVEQLAWFCDSYSTLVCKAHPRIKKALSFEQFLQEQHIRIAPWGESQGIVDQVLANLGHTRHVACQQTSVLVAPHLLAGSEYLLTLPTQVAKQVQQGQKLTRLPPPITVPDYHLQLYWHPLKASNQANRWFVEQVKGLFL
ncbi:LysR family transcriptional regulator [Pseudoalteromonas phenolica]|uniref:LysR family transcriptional regulator n=1 Tax=Pseudoalteromonas phenolica TaxID=161398 RepID=UPI00110BACD1|nr:LysR family transcriptional regulator [Pseudoalteromonas phenolica]TMO57902.1 LysR family transcriptional regulator [Pseudoalteromonas phenolica]